MCLPIKPSPARWARSRSRNGPVSTYQSERVSSIDEGGQFAELVARRARSGIVVIIGGLSVAGDDSRGKWPSDGTQVEVALDT